MDHFGNKQIYQNIWYHLDLIWLSNALNNNERNLILVTRLIHKLICKLFTTSRRETYHFKQSQTKSENLSQIGIRSSNVIKTSIRTGKKYIQFAQNYFTILQNSFHPSIDFYQLWLQSEYKNNFEQISSISSNFTKIALREDSIRRKEYVHDSEYILRFAFAQIVDLHISRTVLRHINKLVN